MRALVIKPHRTVGDAGPAAAKIKLPALHEIAPRRVRCLSEESLLPEDSSLRL